MKRRNRRRRRGEEDGGEGGIFSGLELESDGALVEERYTHTTAGVRC